MRASEYSAQERSRSEITNLACGLVLELHKLGHPLVWPLNDLWGAGLCPDLRSMTEVVCRACKAPVWQAGQADVKRHAREGTLEHAVGHDRQICWVGKANNIACQGDELSAQLEALYWIICRCDEQQAASSLCRARK